MTILVWEDAQTNKPPEFERVLLKIKHSNSPVVGYWIQGLSGRGFPHWSICTDNIETECKAEGAGGVILPNFPDYYVLEYARVGL
jgi:hypothetical protein